MSTNNKPPVRTRGPFKDDRDSGQPSCQSDCKPLMRVRQFAELDEQAQAAKRRGDREAFWQARRAYLLAQAEVYQAEGAR